MSLTTYTHLYQEPLTFYPVDADPVPVEMQQVRAVAKDGLLLDCVITFKVEPMVYSEIDDNLLFHLTVDARNETFGGEFELRPLEIEARLDPQKIRQLSSVASNAKEVAEYLHHLDSHNPLLDTESWYALYVKQEMELPPELADEGSVKVGFSTRWAKELGGRQITSPMFETMITFFEADDWPYERSDDDTLLILLNDNGEYRWKCYAQVRDDDDLVLFYSICPFNIPAPKRAAVMEFITRANYDLPMGNFEFQLDTGEVRFKTSMRFSETAFTPDHMRDLTSINIGAIDQYLPGIKSLLNNNITAVEALASVE